MKEYLSVSEMAELHTISRQTLIYYDKIGLFHPEYIAENGYRYYSPNQIPVLREICFLKAVGVKLDSIREHIHQRNLKTAISLLEYHRDFIDNEISTLVKARQYIQQRLRKYDDARHYKNELNQPYIDRLPERNILFFPYQEVISKQELHVTCMKAWNRLLQHGMLPADIWGTMILKDSLDKDYIFEGSGLFMKLPFVDAPVKNVRIIPEGDYACMYKYGMPYDQEHLYQLLEWIDNLGYIVAGDIIDRCLLDTTFYGKDTDVDFCQLQIPIKKS